MSINFGYCKDCIDYMKGSCNKARGIISATPLKSCHYKKPYKMKSLDFDNDYSYLIGKTISVNCGKYEIDSIARDISKCSLRDKNGVYSLMDLDLVYNIYEYENGMELIPFREIVSKKLNVNKIESLEDVKAVLEVLDIKFQNIRYDSQIMQKISHLLDDIEGGI